MANDFENVNVTVRYFSQYDEKGFTSEAETVVLDDLDRWDYITIERFLSAVHAVGKGPIQDIILSFGAKDEPKARMIHADFERDAYEVSKYVFDKATKATSGAKPMEVLYFIATNDDYKESLSLSDLSVFSQSFTQEELGGVEKFLGLWPKIRQSAGGPVDQLFALSSQAYLALDKKITESVEAIFAKEVGKAASNMPDSEEITQVLAHLMDEDVLKGGLK